MPRLGSRVAKDAEARRMSTPGSPDSPQGSIVLLNKGKIKAPELTFRLFSELKD